MHGEHPLLPDYLEELKTFKDGVFLDRTISIFYNDWSLNQDYEDDYSERVSIETKSQIDKWSCKDHYNSWLRASKSPHYRDQFPNW